MIVPYDNSLIAVQTKKINVRSLQREEDIPECRVCLSPAEEDNELISPCNCTGSVQFIHFKCFKIWMAKKYDDPALRQQIISSAGLKCQICHERYIYTFSEKEEWCTCYSFKRNIIHRKCIALGNTFFIIIDLILLSIMLVYAINDQKDPQYNINQPRFFIVYIALLFALFSLIYGLSEFKKTFLIHKSFQFILHNKTQQPKIRIIRPSQNDCNGPDEATQQSMRVNNNIHHINPHLTL